MLSLIPVDDIRKSRRMNAGGFFAAFEQFKTLKRYTTDTLTNDLRLSSVIDPVYFAIARKQAYGNVLNKAGSKRLRVVEALSVCMR